MLVTLYSAAGEGHAAAAARPAVSWYIMGDPNMLDTRAPCSPQHLGRRLSLAPALGIAQGSRRSTRKRPEILALICCIELRRALDGGNSDRLVMLY